MGDPTGIGPEVIAKALHGRGLRHKLQPILVGDLRVFEQTAELLRLPLRFIAWEPPEPLPSHAVPVKVVSRLKVRESRSGRPTEAGGRAAHAAILEGVRLVQAGRAQAIVTAPICKANLAAAGLAASGHTELLAELTGGGPVAMMMVGSRLRVALVTTHMAIAHVPASLSTDHIASVIGVVNGALRKHFGIRRPHIGVAGLNPHAGEAGLFGHEDEKIIRPAVKKTRRRGIHAEGPLAADSLFPQALAGRFDVIVCMYHDQGLAPFKLLHFSDGVNFTAGLPFVRTSPDHGTAHDIAGCGVADPRSMIAALSLAARLSQRKG
jgi:4-hydroxythreonine-4-phosphate dehydrogenase